MKRLVFIIEGDTEVRFIHQTVLPYLYGKGFRNPMTVQTIITNRKQHKKGGVVNYQYFKNDIRRVLAQGNVIVTTLIDFFRLPTNFPNYTNDSGLIERIEQGIREDIDSPDLLPYIQRHDMESLMFCDINAFGLVVEDKEQLEEIREILAEFPNPEDINGCPEKAPSKRLGSIFNYDKVVDSSMILDFLSLDTIMGKCPRFRAWIKMLVQKLEADR